MRLRRCIAVSLLSVSVVSIAASAQTPQGEPSTLISTRPRDVEKASRFELQRMLAEVDERQQRIRSLLAPADSVLRLLMADSLRLTTATRPESIEEDSATVAALFWRLRQNPGSTLLRAQLLGAAEMMADNFTSIETSLASRVAKPQIARDYLERTPFAAVVPIIEERPLVNAVLVTALRRPEEVVGTPARLPRIYFTEFADAFSDSAFERYKAELIDAISRRAADIRLISRADRTELAKLQQDAAMLSRAIGRSQDDQARLDSRVITFAIPAVGAALIVLLLSPLLYRNQELRRSLITSGMLVELVTVFLLTAAVIILGVDRRIPAEVIGTLLGGVSGYVLGRAINPPARA